MVVAALLGQRMATSTVVVHLLVLPLQGVPSLVFPFLLFISSEDRDHTDSRRGTKALVLVIDLISSPLSLTMSILYMSRFEYPLDYA
jgi:hypothetical protein